MKNTMVSLLQSLFDIIKDGLPLAFFIFGTLGFIITIIVFCVLLIQYLSGWGVLLSVVLLFLVFAILGGLSIRE